MNPWLQLQCGVTVMASSLNVPELRLIRIVCVPGVAKKIRSRRTRVLAAPASLTVPFAFPSIWIDAEPSPGPRAPIPDTPTPVKGRGAVAPAVPAGSTEPPYAAARAARLQPL